MKYVNTTDYTTASSFDEKYNYLAVNGKYNESILEFFSYWCSNSSLADYCLSVFKSVQETNKYLLRMERILSLMKYLNATDYAKVSIFYDNYGHLIEGHNQSVSEFFSYWCSNSSLADIIMSILGSFQEANSYICEYSSAAFSYSKVENTKIVLLLQTDDEEYVQGEKMNLTIVILSSEPLGKILVNIFGFRTRYGGYYLTNRDFNYTGILEFNIMDKIFVKSFKNIYVPSCSPCTGVYPGIHTITCIIKYNNLSMHVTKSFMLKS
ncbi:MAG: hypothetical protein ACUVQY_02815 [Thermoproteota archaeon]